jgi:phosphoglycolate phosphatase
MSAFKVIVFDYDGTLFDTRPAIIHCIQRAFEEQGRNRPEQEPIARTVSLGVTLQETFFTLDRGLRSDAAALSAIVDTYRTLYLDIGTPLLKPYSGMGEALRSVQAAGARCVIVSNKGVAAIRRSLDQNHLGSLIDIVFGDEPNLPKKPDPAVLTGHILPRYPQLRRDQVLMVGDTETDISFARAAGIMSCWAAYGYGEVDRCRALRPDHEIASIDDLPALALSSAPHAVPAR